MKLRVRNLTRQTTLATAADIADTSRTRAVGLLKRQSLAPGEGLLITPCEAIHTFGMKFPIDVIFISRDKRVLKVRPAVARARIALCLRAHSVIELPAGTASQTGTAAGDQLQFEKYD